jgi:acetyltransferase-like isoleucine patch superfamily enzyme
MSAIGLRGCGDSVEIEIPRRTPMAKVVARARHILQAWRWRYSLGSFGARASIAAPARVIGGRSICVGKGVQIWGYARIEALNARPGVTRIEIGDGSVIQPFVHIGAVQRVRIGRGCLFASRVYITDHDHDFSDPSDPVVSNGRVIAAPVEIGDHVWLGEGVIVLRGVSIGSRSIVGAGSVVTRDIPALTVAAGSPARVIRRWDLSSHAWVRVHRP